MEENTALKAGCEGCRIASNALAAGAGGGVGGAASGAGRAPKLLGAAGAPRPRGGPGGALSTSPHRAAARSAVFLREAALEDQRRIIESQSAGPRAQNAGPGALSPRAEPSRGALIEDLSSHLKATSSNEAPRAPVPGHAAPGLRGNIANTRALSAEASLGSAANASAAVSASKEPAPSPTSPEPQGNSCNGSACFSMLFPFRECFEKWQVRQVHPVRPSAGAAAAMGVER